MKFKIAHISDVHIKFEDNINSILLSRLFEDISQNECNHISITGDIVENANRREFETVRSIIEKFGYLDGDKLSVVPGNHDIFGGVSRDIPVYEFPAHCRDLDYQKKEFDFFNFFNESFRNTIRDTEIFPYVKILNDDIIIIGLNSVAPYSEVHNPVGTNGKINDLQLKNLLKLFDEFDVSGKFKIVLLHHYFNKPGSMKNDKDHALWLKSEQSKMKLHNKKVIVDTFRKLKVDVVLHGHNHITETYLLKEMIFINSSGCLRPFTRSKANRYFILEFDTEQKSFKLDMRQIS